MRKTLIICIIILLGVINFALTKEAINNCSKYNDINYCKEALK